jgi:hypothetical protein
MYCRDILWSISDMTSGILENLRLPRLEKEIMKGKEDLEEVEEGFKI